MVKIRHLSNGICIVGEENTLVRSVAIGIWVKNGSVDETKKNNGISHFIEHMMFKGTNTRTAKDIAKEMSAVGGRINAFTGKEYMCYYAHTLDNHLEVALDVLSDMLLNSTSTENSMDKEKGVIIEEINMHEDSPEEIVHSLIHQTAWGDAPLGYNILGTKENIESFSRNNIIEYIESYYIPKNIVISVVGKFDFDDICVKLEKKFSVLENRDTIARNDATTYKKTFVTRDKDIEQVHLCLGFPSINFNSKKIYVLSILNTILGGGIDSKLFQAIREEQGLAYSIYSYVETFNKTGMLNIYAASNPTQIERVLKGTIKEINILLDKGINEKELNKTKEQLKSNLIIGLENMNSRMSSYGKSKLMIDRIKSQDEMIDGINSVTTRELQEFSHKVFNFNNMSGALVGRHKGINVERIGKLCEI